VLKRREERKAAMAAKRDAEKRLKDLERDEKKKAKEAERVAQEEEESAIAADRAHAKAQAAAVTKRPNKRTRRKPLCGTFHSQFDTGKIDASPPCMFFFSFCRR